VEPLQVPVHWASGMTANVEFIVERRDGVLVIPRSAIVERDGGSFVRLFGQGPRPQRIEVGLTDGRIVEVVQGLAEGDTVVTGQAQAGAEESGTGRSPAFRMMMRPR
jgi:macrolide-specific efflux system membrane fusion protein